MVGSTWDTGGVQSDFTSIVLAIGSKLVSGLSAKKLLSLLSLMLRVNLLSESVIKLVCILVGYR